MSNSSFVFDGDRVAQLMAQLREQYGAAIEWHGVCSIMDDRLFFRICLLDPAGDPFSLVWSSVAESGELLEFTDREMQMMSIEKKVVS